MAQRLHTMEYDLCPYALMGGGEGVTPCAYVWVYGGGERGRKKDRQRETEKYNHVN